jgi:hypothetical protein
MAQAATDVELQDVEGFPMGEGLGDYEDLLQGFEPAANVVAALVPVDQRGPVGLVEDLSLP